MATLVEHDSPATRGERLRAARERAGLSREQVALVFETIPFQISAFARAEWLYSIEAGIDEITEEDCARLEAAIVALAAAFGRPCRPAVGAAA